MLKREVLFLSALEAHVDNIHVILEEKVYKKMRLKWPKL